MVTLTLNIVKKLRFFVSENRFLIIFSFVIRLISLNSSESCAPDVVAEIIGDKTRGGDEDDDTEDSREASPFCHKV